MATSASDARSAALAAAAIGAGFTVAGFVGGFIISRKSAGEAAALKVRVAEQAKAAQVTQEMLEARVAELKQMLDGHGGDTTQVASSAGRIADLEAELDYFKVCSSCLLRQQVVNSCASTPPAAPGPASGALRTRVPALAVARLCCVGPPVGQRKPDRPVTV